MDEKSVLEAFLHQPTQSSSECLNQPYPVFFFTPNCGLAKPDCWFSNLIKLLQGKLMFFKLNQAPFEPHTAFSNFIEPFPNSLSHFQLDSAVSNSINHFPIVQNWLSFIKPNQACSNSMKSFQTYLSLLKLNQCWSKLIDLNIMWLLM